MIEDLSKTLRALLSEQGEMAFREPAKLPPELAEAEILFDHPVESFNPQQTTINLFLYDIRENVELRSNELQVVRTNGKVSTRQPPLRIACSYLVTAWPVGGADVALQEHRLLGQVLQVFARYPRIPREFLQGGLVGQEPPLPMVTAFVDPQKNLSEFWTALGNKLRPSLTITVTIAMDLSAPKAESMVLSEEVRFGERPPMEREQMAAGGVEQSFRIGGVVTDSAEAPVAEATVTLVEMGRTARTDAQGRYSISASETGDYTLRVKKGEKEKQVGVAIPARSTSDYNIRLT